MKWKPCFFKELFYFFMSSYRNGAFHNNCFFFLGVFNNGTADYPDIVREVCEKVLENDGAKGLIVCGTGIGVHMTAAKIKGIRPALCTNEYMARMSREHNNANVLCLGERVIGCELAKSILDAFLATDFSDEERHARRVEKIESVAAKLNDKNN